MRLVAGMWCGKEEEPLYAIYGTMPAELRVQRRTKRSELLAFTMVLASLVGLSTIHTDNMGIIVCCGGEKNDALDRSRRMRIFMDANWELLTECAEKDWNLDVKQVKAHRTEKEKNAMTQMQEFVIDE